MSKIYDRAVCIALDKRKKEITIHKELEPYGINVEMFWVGNGGDPEIEYSQVDNPNRPQRYNYATALQTIVRKAKEDELRHLLLLEDDATLSKHFANIFPTLTDFTYDILYLGGKFNDPKCTRSEPLGDFLFYKNYILDLHAVVLRQTSISKGFDIVLDIEPSDSQSIDGLIAEKLRENKIFSAVVHPNIILQKPGFSYSWGSYLDQYKDYE